MTREEFNGWAKFMATSAGHWTVDPIHDGVTRDLIVFCPTPADPSTGLVVIVDRDGSWRTGRYAEAYPCVTDGIVTTKRCGKADDFDGAIKAMVEGLGLSFLLALTHGRSPYRSL